MAAATLAVAFSFPAHAEFTGTVIDVVDGDTITVLDANQQRHKIRLAGIDAPERGQAFGFRSKENLAKWITEREAIIEADKYARRGMLVGKVYVDGHDAGLEQIRAGLAWWDRPSANAQSPEDRELYELAEKQARERKLRLWRDARPVPPWEWRSSHR
ncbi:MAG: thermonuclease family protein [Burkholderiales bacterium]|nr:thermonuclease family protein [Burkholderiales bacterium]